MRRTIPIAWATAIITALTLAGSADAYVRVTTGYDHIDGAKYCLFHTDGHFGDGSVIEDRFYMDQASTFPQRVIWEAKGLDFIDDLLSLSPSNPSEESYIVEEDIPEALEQRITSQGFNLENAVYLTNALENKYLAKALDNEPPEFILASEISADLPDQYPHLDETGELSPEHFERLKESASKTDFTSLETFNDTSSYFQSSYFPLYNPGDSPGMTKLKEAAFQKLRPSLEASFNQLLEMDFEQYRAARVSDWQTAYAHLEACRKWEDGAIDVGEIPDYAGTESGYKPGTLDPGPEGNGSSAAPTPTSTSAPTPTVTPTPTSTSAPKPAVTPTPTSTSTPKPAVTPTPTSTSAPTPTVPEAHEDSGVAKRLTMVTVLLVIAAFGGLFAWLTGFLQAFPALF
ncbi:hypothetical protein [Corynebacterium sp. TAE3-ERU16]|uniref:hypothetical protein n=1 Tax=Corynebacterium sp. TAE3-ERU16 TaxID=2849493 RepID=UPI001C44B9E8|nr:hypothetical protein [Corynebacterium sp. TAE3-ERU16]MBV7293080.1 hypothetical protein [Corynebacterium sp. TAE3-ERU16]